MHWFLENLGEIISLSAIETLFHHPMVEAVGEFFGKVAASTIAHVIIAALAVAAGWFAWLELPGRIKAWTISRGNPYRLNVLLARFAGEGSLDIKDRITEQLNRVFGDIANRPFEVINFPLTLRMPEAGKESEIQANVIRKGRRWLQRARGDLLIWGRTSRVRDRATIYFLLPHDLGRSGGDTADPADSAHGASLGVPQAKSLPGSRIYEFDIAPEKFGEDAAKAIAYAAVMCVRPIFEAETVSKLKPQYALDLIRKLEPFVSRPVPGLPDNLVSEIRDAYRSASIGLGQQGVLDGWRQAIKMLEDHLSRIDRNADPARWVQAAGALADLLYTAGDQAGANEWLERAIVLYREVLTERTRERVPLDWTRTQNNLGHALLRLGERESETARLEEAVAAYRAALTEWTHERAPLDWALTQIGLGGALLRLGERESGTARLEEAVAAHRAALMEWTRQRAPLDWAMTQNNLGIALATLGERESGTA